MKRYRSAVTGEYVTEEYAEANPTTTVSETAAEEWKMDEAQRVARLDDTNWEDDDIPF